MFPKFGNWEGDNVPYTACFENARKEKACGVRINPNDPDQNPEAFSLSPNDQTPPPRFANQRSTYDQQKKSDRNRYASDDDSLMEPSPGTYDDDFSYRSVSVPKFGEWDVNDPRSAEGFTFIFNKVKEEKKTAATKFPPVPLQTTNSYPIGQKKANKKKCCCLF